MKIYLDCLPCLLRQGLEASRLATDKEEVQAKIMKEILDLISDYENYRYSPEIGREMHQIVKKHTGVLDPYKSIKEDNIKSALDIYPTLKHFLFRKADRLYWALKIAATGNIIDYGVYSNVNIEESINQELNKEFSIDHTKKLKGDLKESKNLLIIGDNAGETVFDKVLIEDLLYLDITYAVRDKPIINDATLEDARASGLGQSTRLISTGCKAPGLIIEECSKEFLDIYNKADIIISKGQGNYETLSGGNRKMFFLLKAKCPVISDRLGVNVNDYVFQWHEGNK